MAENTYWGFHLQINALCSSSENFDDRNHAQNFIDELVDKIKMVKFGPMHFNIFGEGNKQGPSGFQLIETSNIAWHACNESGAFYLDIFSCMPYDEKIAIEVFEKYYPSKTMNTKMILRLA